MTVVNLDAELYLENELATARRELSNDLYHYTSADAAVLGILATGTLRLSPFASTNDLWESRPYYPGLSSHHDDSGDDELDAMELWKQIDHHIRLHAKVACLTQDWEVDRNVLDPDSLRGWAHLSLWAHYGGAHSGVCLRFDRTRLLDAFGVEQESDLIRRNGAVTYRSVSSGVGPESIDIGQIRQFGVDAVAAAYAEKNSESIFFRKHSDWSNEAEYRLVLLNTSVLPAHVDIRAALNGVFLGDAFPSERLPALQAALEGYPDAAIHPLRFHNRRLFTFPPMRDDPDATVDSDPTSAIIDPLTPGTLQERLTVLRFAETAAIDRRSRARERSAGLAQELHDLVASFSNDMESWESVESAVHDSIAAVPEHVRGRRPGLPGEQVHFEFGAVVVAENLPKRSHTLVVAVAAQVLDGDQVRVHAVVSLETWTPGENRRDELWRVCSQLAFGGAPAHLTQLDHDLRSAASAGRAEFDRSRDVAGQSEADPTPAP